MKTSPQCHCRPTGAGLEAGQIAEGPIFPAEGLEVGAAEIGRRVSGGAVRVEPAEISRMGVIAKGEWSNRRGVGLGIRGEQGRVRNSMQERRI